jgi:hypothetical protein
MSGEPLVLPVPVREGPHWRVNFRPERYSRTAIESLSECWRTMETNEVKLRGWSYPYVNPRKQERQQGTNWIGAFVDFDGTLEYWRFYQSRQFIHLFSVLEYTKERWREQLRNAAEQNLRAYNYISDWAGVPGFISIGNFIWTIAEIHEFAARLCRAGVYEGKITIGVQLNGIKGFVLSTDARRFWRLFCQANEDNIENARSIAVSDLAGESASISEEAAVWFLERFGWEHPSRDVIRKEIDTLLSGKVWS